MENIIWRNTGRRRCSAAKVLRKVGSQTQHDGEAKLKAMGTAQRQIGQFPYYRNYEDLVAMELDALRIALPELRPRTFAVMGSGPLPMTALCLLKSLDQSHCWILNMDHSLEAVSSAEKLCSTLDVDGHVGNLCVEAASPMDLRKFDVVYLAALVGSDSQGKKCILASLAARMRPGAVIMSRSAHSLRQLLYPVSRLYTPYNANTKMLPAVSYDQGMGRNRIETVAYNSSMQQCCEFYQCQRCQASFAVEQVEIIPEKIPLWSCVTNCK